MGQLIMGAIEGKLRALGCPKINLLIKADNLGAVKFYESIGYKENSVEVLSKRLYEDEPFTLA